MVKDHSDVREETRCHHMGYSFRLAVRVLLYASSHRQDNTYHGLCYTSSGTLAGTRNSSMGKWGARCSSVVRAFTHGTIGCWIDPSWWTHSAISHFGRSSTTKTVAYDVCWTVHITDPLMLTGKAPHKLLAAGFFSFLEVIVNYARQHMTLNVLSASLNKTFPSLFDCVFTWSASAMMSISFWACLQSPRVTRVNAIPVLLWSRTKTSTVKLL